MSNKDQIDHFIDTYSSFVSCLNDQVNDTLHELNLEKYADILQAKLINDVLVSLISSNMQIREF